MTLLFSSFIILVKKNRSEGCGWGGWGAFVSRNHNSRERKAGKFVSMKNYSRLKNQVNQGDGVICL